MAKFIKAHTGHNAKEIRINADKIEMYKAGDVYNGLSNEYCVGTIMFIAGYDLDEHYELIESVEEIDRMIEGQ